MRKPIKRILLGLGMSMCLIVSLQAAEPPDRASMQKAETPQNQPSTLSTVTPQYQISIPNVTFNTKQVQTYTLGISGTLPIQDKIELSIPQTTNITSQSKQASLPQNLSKTSLSAAEINSTANIGYNLDTRSLSAGTWSGSTNLNINYKAGDPCPPWFTFDTTTGKITKFNPGHYTGQKLIIPETIQGIPVKVIGVKAFENVTSLIDIELPKCLEVIEWAAFIGCSNLSTMTIPPKVTFIGFACFQGCSSLTAFNIPSGVKAGNIGEKAFVGCTSLRYLSNESPDYYCLYNQMIIDHNGTRLFIPATSGMYTFNIPVGITTIAQYAFCGMNLPAVTIPYTCTTLEEGVFYTCQIKDIYIDRPLNAIPNAPWGGYDSTIHWATTSNRPASEPTNSLGGPDIGDIPGAGWKPSIPISTAGNTPNQPPTLPSIATPGNTKPQGRAK